MNRPNPAFFFGLRTSAWYAVDRLANADLLRAMSVDAARNGVLAGNYVYNAFVDRRHGVLAILRQPLPGTGNSASVSLCKIDVTDVGTCWDGAAETDLGKYVAAG